MTLQSCNSWAKKSSLMISDSILLQTSIKVLYEATNAYYIFSTIHSYMILNMVKYIYLYIIH